MSSRQGRFGGPARGLCGRVPPAAAASAIQIAAETWMPSRILVAAAWENPSYVAIVKDISITSPVDRTGRSQGLQRGAAVIEVL